VSGTVSFNNATYSPGATLNISKAQAGATVTITGAELGGDHLVATTDANGSFSFPSVPANVTGNYTVTVAQNHFVATTTGSSATTVTVNAGQSSPATGLSLKVNAGAVQATAIFRDNSPPGCGLSCTTYDGCSVCTCFGDAAGGGLALSLSGTAFTGDAISPNAITTNTTGFVGVATFTLPPGSYTVSAAPPGRSSSAQFTTVSDAHTSCASLTFADQIAPTEPVIASQTGSPTSKSHASIALVQGSTDATSPTSNFKDYQIRTCSPVCTGNGGWNSWDGASPSVQSLANGVDNNIFVYAEDGAGNVSPTTVVTVHAENRPPPQPANLHVDNRNGSVRISWDPPPETTSVPVAGYLLYYSYYSVGLPLSFAGFTGDFLSQGPSPIRIPGQSSTELTLSGLPNTPFIVALAAYDSVTDPAPNISPDTNLPTGAKVNPNTSPLDSAIHTPPGQQLFAAQTPYTLFNSAAVLRDAVFVSQATPNPAGTTACTRDGSGNLTNFANVPPFAIRAYVYDKYGQNGLTELPNSGTLSSGRARMLVADENRYIYGFDTGNYSPLPNATPRVAGVDVIDAAVPGNLTLAGTALSTFVVDHLLPLHRPDSGGAGASHGVVTYQDTGSLGTFRIATFSFSHSGTPVGGCDATASGPAGVCNQIQLHTHSQPLDVQVAWPVVFALHSTSLDAYVISANFRTITYAGSLALANTSAAGAMAVDWPRVYFAVNNSTALFNDSPQLYVTTASVGGTTVSFTAASSVASLHGYPTHMLEFGDQLVVGEGDNTDLLVESFGLQTPDSPALLGNYRVDQSLSVDFGGYGIVNSMQRYGSNLFLTVTADTTSTFCTPEATLDVVEMGSPRITSALGSALLPLNLPYPFAIQTRGSRALVLGQQELFDVDLHQGLHGFSPSTYTVSPSFFALLTGCSDVFSQAANNCYPLALSGDYAYVFQPNDFTQCATPGCNLLGVYDVSTPNALAAGTAVPLINVDYTRNSTTVSAPVHGIAVANDYLFATLDSTTDYVARWDISNPASPVGPALIATPSDADGHAIDLYGRYAYVGTHNGFCVVDAFATPNPLEVGCLAVSCGGVNVPADYLSVDGNRLYLSNGEGNCADTFEYDISTPSNPVLLSGTYLPNILGITNGPIWRDGVTFYDEPPGAGGLGAVVGFDLHGPSPIVTNSIQLTAAPLAFAVTGSMLLFSDGTAGLSAVRLY
jgi:hypothetical protein